MSATCKHIYLLHVEKYVFGKKTCSWLINQHDFNKNVVYLNNKIYIKNKTASYPVICFEIFINYL